MDVPTNGYASPPVEGVGSEAGPLASPAPAPAPQGAMPQTSQSALCDIAGQWRMDTANVGQSTWTFTSSGSGSYAGQEQGLGNATGTAAMNGSAMRLEWRTGGYSGLVEITIDPSCSSGQGYQIFHTGRTGSESTRWTRIGAAPAAAAAAAATGGDAGSDAAGPAPSPIKLHAVIGGVDITAVLIRTGPDSWEWVERGNTFRFRPLLDSSTQLVIYDRSRDMFLQDRRDRLAGRQARRRQRQLEPALHDHAVTIEGSYHAASRSTSASRLRRLACELARRLGRAQP
jgi:hypothetical protein